MFLYGNREGKRALIFRFPHDLFPLFFCPLSGVSHSSLLARFHITQLYLQNEMRREERKKKKKNVSFLTHVFAR